MAIDTRCFTQKQSTWLIAKPHISKEGSVYKCTKRGLAFAGYGDNPLSAFIALKNFDLRREKI